MWHCELELGPGHVLFCTNNHARGFTGITSLSVHNKVASVAGAVVWVVLLPFTLLGGNTAEAGDALVMDPLCSPSSVLWVTWTAADKSIPAVCHAVTLSAEFSRMH